MTLDLISKLVVLAVVQTKPTLGDAVNFHQMSQVRQISALTSENNFGEP